LPLELVAGKPRRLSNPQLVLEGDQLALTYETSSGWLRRGRLGELPKLGPPIKITNHVVPLNGSRVHVTGDGKVFLLTGKDTVWLLQADLKDLLRAPSQD